MLRPWRVQHEDAYAQCGRLMWLGAAVAGPPGSGRASPAQQSGAGPRRSARSAPRRQRAEALCERAADLRRDGHISVRCCLLIPDLFFPHCVHGPPQITVGASSATSMLCLAHPELQQSWGLTGEGLGRGVPCVAQSCASLTWHACLRRTPLKSPAWLLRWRLPWGGPIMRWLLGRS